MLSFPSTSSNSSRASGDGPRMATHPLTKCNLATHDQRLQRQHATESITRWVEKVITEERTRLFYSQMSDSIGDINLERDLDHLDHEIGLSLTAAGTNLDGLKLFDQQLPLGHLDSPLERFLTPGYGDACFISRPALAHMGIQYGSMEGLNERIDITRRHVEVVKKRLLERRKP